MKIYGLDFTSAPGHRKPITLAVCDLQKYVLRVTNCVKLSSFEDFEAFLGWDGPCLAALDFPFGQPRKLISNLGWLETWEAYVQVIGCMAKNESEESRKRSRETM